MGPKKKALRLREKGWTYKRIAESLSMNPSTLYYLLNGNQPKSASTEKRRPHPTPAEISAMRRFKKNGYSVQSIARMLGRSWHCVNARTLCVEKEKE